MMALILVPLSIYANNIIFVDKSDRQPISGVSIITGNGTIIGLTDNNGSFDCTPDVLPLKIRCIGYEERTLDSIIDTLYLYPKSYELAEILVTPVDRPILKINCYIREYTTATYSGDTIQMFGEYMADYFLNEKKSKGFRQSNTPYVRAKRLRARYRNGAGLDSIAKPSENDEFLSWIDLCSIDPEHHTLPDSVLNGATNNIMGKYGQFSSSRIFNNKFIYSRDILANHKGHHWSPWFFKLIGFTIDTSKMLSKDIFLIDDHGGYGPNTLQMATYTMEMTIKGKWIKKAFNTKDPIKSYSIVEVYPIESQYLTVQEAKDLEWDYSQKEIIRSPLAPELPLNILEMLNQTSFR